MIDADSADQRHGRAVALFTQAWNELNQGASRSNHAYHLAILTTISQAEEKVLCDDSDVRPEARTVVLRWVDRDSRMIGCHTDVRCPKVAQVRANPATAWVVYDSESRLQVQLYGTSTIHTDDALAGERWAASALTSRRCYLGHKAPASIVERPQPNLPDDLLHRVPTEAESAAGRVNFAALATHITSMEILHLAHDGHERIRFSWSEHPPHETALAVEDAWGLWLIA